MKINFERRDHSGATTWMKTNKSGIVTETNNGLYIGDMVKIEESQGVPCLYIKHPRMKGFTQMMGLKIVGVEND